MRLAGGFARLASRRVTISARLGCIEDRTAASVAGFIDLAMSVRRSSSMPLKIAAASFGFMLSYDLTREAMRPSDFSSILASKPWTWVSSALSSAICSLRRASAAPAAASRVPISPSRASSVSRRACSERRTTISCEESPISSAAELSVVRHCSGVGGAAAPAAAAAAAGASSGGASSSRPAVSAVSSAGTTAGVSSASTAKAVWAMSTPLKASAPTETAMTTEKTPTFGVIAFMTGS